MSKGKGSHYGWGTSGGKYKMPAVTGLHPDIKDNTDGTINIEYHPQQQGRHEVQMTYDGIAIEGSPFSCVVDAVDGGYVTAFGPGLTGGMVGQTESFEVVAKHGSLKDVSVAIDGPTKVDLTREEKGEHVMISYMPMSPGAFNIAIKFKNKHIKGSPFPAKVSGEGRKRSQLSLGNTADYCLNVMEPDIVDLHGSLKLPSGPIEPCILKKTQEGKLSVAGFTPKEKGTYQVQIYRDEKHIQGSPFKINVGDKELAHAAKVHITGNTTEATANQPNHLSVDTTNAGYGCLSIVMEGPHRSEIECDEIQDGRIYKIYYSPHEPGIYILHVRYADEHIAGSPFLLNSKGDPSGRVRETITHEMAAAACVTPGKFCEFILKIPGTNPFDMEAAVTDPDGNTELCDVMDEEDSHYRITFTPKFKGVHILSIKHKALHISGSPFQYTIGQLQAGGYHKVQVGGPGLERGEVGLKNCFNIYTREAGSGSLSVSVEGPSKAAVKLEERPNGFLGVSYDVTRPGQYGIHVKFDDQHIPNSPIKVNVAPDSGTARQVTVHALKDRGLAIDRPVTFTVSFNGATGSLHSSVRTPSGGHEDAFVQEMDTGVYAVRFVPRENGVHYIDVKLNDAHIPDSPFAMLVGSQAADPAMVHAIGDGVEKGVCGQKAKFLVKTAGSGTGFLAVFIDGPSKAAVSCKEVDEGYEFTWTPFSPGKYLITVKYGNINIAGSPYQATVTGTGRKASPINEQTSMVVETVEKKPGAKVQKKFRGDASKVVARGNGLKKAFTNRMQNFTIDVKDAGNAILSVGMISPAGLPEPELSIKKGSPTSYQVNYKVNEIGDHVLSVKWGEDDIPGSPFVLST